MFVVFWIVWSYIFLKGQGQGQPQGTTKEWGWDVARWGLTPWIRTRGARLGMWLRSSLWAQTRAQGQGDIWHTPHPHLLREALDLTPSFVPYLPTVRKHLWALIPASDKWEWEWPLTPLEVGKNEGRACVAWRLARKTCSERVQSLQDLHLQQSLGAPKIIGSCEKKACEELRRKLWEERIAVA